jgi:adenine-specific DNA-methyltransferase
LRRELDFYIKNEIMHLDNIENESAPRVEEYLSKIKVIRQIAHKIIDFLAQIEDFQKKLWLKKKFVVETNYCITLDRIPEELYPEIAANDAQREEWVRLFAINKIKKDLVTAGYSNPLTIEFLKANPFLVLDTKFFNQKFKYKVLASIEDIDEFLNGLLVHSENFQALNLLQGRYANTINCIYIDPPYNAKSSEILYKNTFKHSSWLSLMANRLSLGKQLLQDDFVHIIAIDEIEQEVLGQLINIKFPNDKKVCISIVHNPRGQQGKNISYTHDFAYFIYPSDEKKYIQDV